jgi:hypothetical protein
VVGSAGQMGIAVLHLRILCRALSPACCVAAFTYPGVVCGTLFWCCSCGALPLNLYSLDLWIAGVVGGQLADIAYGFANLRMFGIRERLI